MMNTDNTTRFAICIQNSGAEDLELRKVYEVIPDDAAERDGYVRIIDESGEDYLYPAGYFIPIELSEAAKEAVQMAA